MEAKVEVIERQEADTTPSTERFLDPFSLPAELSANASVDLLESMMRQRLNVIELETTHHFADGTYARELMIPAGVLLTGKIHKTRHLNIISKGSITVWSEKEGTRRIEAPCTFVAGPGTRRVGFAHEDTIWTTIHASDETDLDKLEALLIEPRIPELDDATCSLIMGGF